jgi:hypothetical protein
VALFTAAPTATEAAAYGLTVEEASGPAVEIWPDNLETVNVFIAMMTQWRTGYAGATGLDYAALPSVMQFCGVARKARADVFDGLRVMESAALAAMYEARK